MGGREEGGREGGREGGEERNVQTSDSTLRGFRIRGELLGLLPLLPPIVLPIPAEVAAVPSAPMRGEEDDL